MGTDHQPNEQSNHNMGVGGPSRRTRDHHHHRLALLLLVAFVFCGSIPPSSGQRATDLKDAPIAGSSIQYLDSQAPGDGWIAYAPTASSCSYQQDTDFNPGPITPHADAASAQECCNACSASSSCAGAVFFQGVCWLKSADDVKKPVTSAGRVACIPSGGPPSANITLSKKVVVPGDLISDLEREGLIGDPLYELNWKNSSLWDHYRWTYARTFDASPALLSSDEVHVVFDGIKMGATITLNGQPLGTAQDQFLRYAFPAKQWLRERANRLEVQFDSGLDVQGRFMACTGGWDWAPYSNTRDQHGATTFSKGIWKSVYLVGVTGAAITHVVPEVTYLGQYPTAPLTDADHGGFSVRLRVYWQAPARPQGQPVTGTLTVHADWDPANPVQQSVVLNQGESVSTLVLPQASSGKVSLWWPNGFGPQPLYGITAAFTPTGAPQATATVERRVGFRYAVLVTGNDTDPDFVRQAASQDGSAAHTMMFRVNGAPVFAMGGNVIPMEELEGRADFAATRLMVEFAARANMNMLRIWGGGIFQYDAFYDACDELGLLVYHDMMYAQGSHSPNPQDKDQDAEIRHQVRRLSHRPSIVMWDSCNECGGGGVYQTFVATTVAAEDGTRSLWASCPSDGWQTGVVRLTSFPNPSHTVLAVGGGVVETHGPYQHGSTNAFTPVNGGNKEELFTPQLLIDDQGKGPIGPTSKGRFASEFGCVAMSSFESMSVTLAQDHWGVNAPVMSERNYPCDNVIHSYFGVQQNLSGIGPAAFQRQLYQCMLGQALFMKNDIEQRRAGNTWGVLTWQLNEIWPTGGWGSLEYGSPRDGQVVGGRWKPLHYLMRSHVYAPVVSVCASSGACYVRNDSPYPIANASLTVGLLRLSASSDAGGVTPVSATGLTMPAGAGQQRWVCARGGSSPSSCDPWSSILTQNGCSADGSDCAIVSEVVDRADGRRFSSNLQLIAPPKALKPLPAAKVSFSIGTPTSNGQIPVTVSSDRVALYVVLTTLAQGYFTDNAFPIPSPKQAVVVEFVPNNGDTNAALASLRSSLRVEHLQMYMQTGPAAAVVLPSICTQYL